MRWMDRRAAWQYALIAGSTTLLLVLGTMGTLRLLGHHVDFSSMIIGIFPVTVAATTGGAWRRQRRLDSNERVSIPGRMHPYVSLTSVCDTNEPGKRHAAPGER